MEHDSHAPRNKPFRRLIFQAVKMAIIFLPILVLVIGVGSIRITKQAINASGSIWAALGLSALVDPASTRLQVYLNGACFSKITQGENIKVSILATATTSEPGVTSPLYEKAYRFSRTKLNAKRQIATIGIDLSTLLAVRPGLKNTLISVSVCQDSRPSVQCDRLPSFQALRLNGPFFETTSPPGKLSVEFLSDPKGQGCPN